MTGKMKDARRLPVDDQREVLAFLSSPASYGPGVSKVERIDTHAAVVFLAGDRAYKIKRAVCFPFLDFSTLERRRWACEREIAINRRTAPKLYLDAAPITREAAGLAVGGKGKAIEWAVCMRRFDQAALFDRMAREGRLDAGRMAETADVIHAFHGAAPRLHGEAAVGGGGKAMRWVIDENLAEFDERPNLFPPAMVAALRAGLRESLERVGGLLDERVEAGFVRRCHGDLHLRNICLFEEKPTLFDAIEFNDRFAAIDVLDDLAFLLMDLDHRGLRPFANLVFNRYFQATEDFSGLRALPLFLSCRAAVRAKVSAIAEASQGAASAAASLRAEAMAYFEEAAAYLTPKPARLIGIGGLSGTGKTSLARALSPGVGAAPGALHVRSDVLRKQLFGVAETVPLPPSAYTPEVSRRVYEEMERRARSALAAGHAVIVDAVFAHAGEREAFEAIAGGLGAAFAGLWLEASPETLIARVGERRADASDATPEVVRQQLLYETGPVRWQRLAAGGPPGAVAKAAAVLLEGPR